MAEYPTARVSRAIGGQGQFKTRVFQFNTSEVAAKLEAKNSFLHLTRV